MDSGVVECSTLKPHKRCCALNCANHDKIARLFRFPRDPERRQFWTNNCRGNGWIALNSHRLCEAHFDQDQFELLRADGRKLLKWNAVPTVFSGSSEQRLLNLKRPVALPVDHLIRSLDDGYSKRPDHDYSKRPCLRKEYLLQDEVAFPSAASTSVQHLPTANSSSNEGALPVMSPLETIYCNGEVVSLAELVTTSSVEVTDCAVLDPLSQATMSDSLSQFVAAQSGDDKALVCSLRKRIRRLERKVRLACEQATTMKKNLSRFLNTDQIDSLQCKAKSKGMRWSNKTVKKSLQIRCATGVKGYNHLIREGFPLPSYRTLCERVEEAHFEPGIQHNVLDWLQVKVDSCGSDEAKDCLIALDEMQIQPTIEFDRGLKKYVGFVTKPFESATPATHVLVFIVRGVCSPWKQTVAHYFTADSTPGNLLWKVTKEVIAAVENAGFFVRACVSDMGSANQDMWKSVGIRSSRDNLTNFVVHPVRADCKLYFMAGPPHLLKNIRNCLLAQTIVLPEEVVRLNSLPSQIVDLQHVRDLISIQDGMELKVVPSLKQVHVNHLGKFEKMKVNMAAQVLSHSTGTEVKN